MKICRRARLWLSIYPQAAGVGGPMQQFCNLALAP